MPASTTWAERERFQKAESAALEVWRLTNDPTVRDHANYHNTQCWSPDGRYISYTHYAANEYEYGSRSAAEIHLFDTFSDLGGDVDHFDLPSRVNRKSRHEVCSCRALTTDCIALG